MVVRQGGQSRGLQHKAAVLMQTVLRSGVRTSSVVRGACCLAGWLMVTSHALAAETITFNRDIRPILSDNCFFCHGPDAGTREAELRLDTAEGLFGEAGVQGTVLPGDPAASELIRRIRSSDADELMPPPESHKELTSEQIALLERWVAEGADYEGHWAFEPVVVADTAHSSTTEAIDDLVSRRLAERELPAVGQADRVTLLRRLHFDLTGLPPTPAEAEAFLADGSPDAYEQLVDRLLSSPHYGERMAMWWLDLVRYADTVGYHGDQPMSVSPFRDYVIAAFNSNMPFDQFTIEQLAGDLLEEPTTQQQIAAGYNRLGMMSAEGGVQPKEYLAKYIAERVRQERGSGSPSGVRNAMTTSLIRSPAATSIALKRSSPTSRSGGSMPAGSGGRISRCRTTRSKPSGRRLRNRLQRRSSSCSRRRLLWWLQGKRGKRRWLRGHRWWLRRWSHEAASR